MNHKNPPPVRSDSESEPSSSAPEVATSAQNPRAKKEKHLDPLKAPTGVFSENFTQHKWSVRPDDEAAAQEKADKFDTKLNTRALMDELEGDAEKEKKDQAA